MDQERIAKLEAQVEGIKDDVRDVKDDIKELHSRITTGNREIMDKIDQMETKLEQKMTAGAAVAKQQHEEIQKAVQGDIVKLGDRVTLLERWRMMIVGGAIVLGYILGNLDIITRILK